MSKITKDQINHLANLSKIEIKEEELDIYKENLESIVRLIDKISDIDTKNIKPTYHVLDLVNVFREDNPKKGLDIKEVFKNSCEKEGNQFKVPTIIE